MEGGSLNQIMEERLKKLQKLKEMGLDPFSITKFEKRDDIESIRKKYENIKVDEKIEEVEISTAGRILNIRKHGKLAFADLFDGKKIQILFDESTLKENYKIFIELVDIGDIIGVKGFPFKTKKGELTIWVKEFQLLAKSLRPLPSKWYGLKDEDLRYRMRYVDLIVNEKSREILLTRAKIVKSMREFLEKKGFVEIETPILQPIYGGAFARPFITHHNSLDMDLYLRISDELYLKRLIVGGIEKVYEIGRNFRNEGIDTKHNPEFTMMECYWAYADYKDIMKLTEEMIAYIAENSIGKLEIEYGGHKINLRPPWRKIKMRDCIKEEGIDVESLSREDLIRIAKERRLEVNENLTKGDLINLFFEELVQPKLIQPTFVMDYPLEISPLAKRKKDDPNFVERFECFIAGMEIANAFSELNDPLDQKERFIQQSKRRREGLDFHEYDEDFIRALEYGMPPTGGLGVGIDRLVMILTNSHSIREVIAFPTLRPEKK
ncbi:MAG: lysine--tRNA ligase [Candidatus Aenigmarchaeota archaeon]|nr:lysine--tRNA ligase [Candidatus Aenigmarchaeota archaeon]